MYYLCIKIIVNDDETSTDIFNSKQFLQDCFESGSTALNRL